MSRRTFRGLNKNLLKFFHDKLSDAESEGRSVIIFKREIFIEEQGEDDIYVEMTVTCKLTRPGDPDVEGEKAAAAILAQSSSGS